MEIRYIKTLIALGMLSLLCIYYLNSIPYVLLAAFLGLSPIILYYGLTHPYFFCLIFYAFSVFRLHEVIPVLYPYKIPLTSAILGIASLVINLLQKKTLVYWQKEMRTFLIFFLFISVGVPLSYNFEISYLYWSQVFLKIGIMFFMIAWTIYDKNTYRLVIFTTIACGVFISLITIQNKISGANLVEGSRATIGTNANSVISDPNDLALTLLFPFSFCCSLFITKSTSILLRIMGLFSSMTLISAIIATQSRGGLLGLAGVLGYFITHRFKSKTLVITVSSLALLLLFFIAHISVRQSGGAGQGLDESSMGRIYAWEAAVNMAIHHPIWGIGLNGFEESLFNYAIVWERMNRAVHSSWFGVLAEGGFVGFMLFILCVYQAMKLAYNNITLIETHNLSHVLDTELILARSLYAGLIGFCISSTFLTQGFTWPFYVFFALSISLSHNLMSTGPNLVRKMA